MVCSLFLLCVSELDVCVEVSVQWGQSYDIRDNFQGFSDFVDLRGGLLFLLDFLFFLWFLLFLLFLALFLEVWVVWVSFLVQIEPGLNLLHLVEHDLLSLNHICFLCVEFFLASFRRGFSLRNFVQFLFFVAELTVDEVDVRVGGVDAVLWSLFNGGWLFLLVSHY